MLNGLLMFLNSFEELVHHKVRLQYLCSVWLLIIFARKDEVTLAVFFFLMAHYKLFLNSILIIPCFVRGQSVSVIALEKMCERGFIRWADPFGKGSSYFCEEKYK